HRHHSDLVPPADPRRSRGRACRRSFARDHRRRSDMTSSRRDFLKFVVAGLVGARRPVGLSLLAAPGLPQPDIDCRPLQICPPGPRRQEFLPPGSEQTLRRGHHRRRSKRPGGGLLPAIARFHAAGERAALAATPRWVNTKGKPSPRDRPLTRKIPPATGWPAS